MLNPKIINVLFKTCEIESFGYGFENTFKICMNNKIKYEYENTKSRFIFYRPLALNYFNDLSETDKDVYDIIKKDNYISAKEIASKIKKSDKTVYRSIKNLKDLKYIERVGDDFKGYWKVL